MVRIIDADRLIGVMEADIHFTAINASEQARVNNLLCDIRDAIQEQPTIDAIPVSFIESEIKRMEDEIEHALIKYKHADGTIERMIARKASLEFVLAKWRAERSGRYE